ncbi:MAG: aldehyde dehydrogenase family protein [Anaerolineales bacterium]|nr:aldehyde dehydrogenase family protein [Anaerolineales bacterium]
MLLSDRHLGELEGLAHHSGLLLGLDGLMPEGGEPQLWLGSHQPLWVVRELQTGWTLRHGHNRAQILYFIGENLHVRRAEFAERIVASTGCPLKSARAEVEAAVERLFVYAAWADKYGGTVQETTRRARAARRSSPPASWNWGYDRQLVHDFASFPTISDRPVVKLFHALFEVGPCELPSKRSGSDAVVFLKTHDALSQ